MLEFLDDGLNTLVAKMELEGEHCGLKHSSFDPSENHPAVDYLCQNLGNQKTGEVEQQIRVPVCQECTEALYDNNWILMYCTFCHKSQWISRRLAKNEYPDGNIIYWQDICPHCAEIKDRYDENDEL